MGFQLHGLLTVDRGAIALYERLIPGGSAWVVPVSGEGLPDAWVLPEPAHVDDALGDTATQDLNWFDHETDTAWRTAAGVPAEDAPVSSLDIVDLRLASLLSLAAPAGVVYMGDSTFGGILDIEYAAAFKAGRLVAAAGIKHAHPNKNDSTAFELRDGTYTLVKPEEISPIADCATILDPRFEGAFLFDGYLPRTVYPASAEPPATPTTDPVTLTPETLQAWSPYFPLLRS